MTKNEQWHRVTESHNESAAVPTNVLTSDLVDRGYEEAIGSMPKGLRKGSAACRWMERVDESIDMEKKDRNAGC